MTFGQLFTQMYPDIRVKENGTCVWLYIDDVNHYTFGADWWNTEIKEQPEIVRYTDNPYTELSVSSCPKCGKVVRRYSDLDDEAHYCPWCGKAVK